MKWLRMTLLALTLLLLVSCGPLTPGRGVDSGRLPGPQNPGVMVDDDGRCRFTRSAMLDRPAATVWAVGCR